jgi:dienelactone hydrolase
METHSGAITREVRIPSGEAVLNGSLSLPAGAAGLVLFAHGSGSSRLSSRNIFVARAILQLGIGTLLFDLLTSAEEQIDNYTREHRFDIPLLARRLLDASEWIRAQPQTMHLPLGYFGASTGSAAALIAAADSGGGVSAVVSRGGRPDLVNAATLSRVTAPTLFIVGGLDDVVIQLNRDAYQHLHCDKAFEIVPGATHLFEEPGTLDVVARIASGWFQEHLGSRLTTGRPEGRDAQSGRREGRDAR